MRVKSVKGIQNYESGINGEVKHTLCKTCKIPQICFKFDMCRCVQV